MSEFKPSIITTQPASEPDWEVITQNMATIGNKLTALGSTPEFTLGDETFYLTFDTPQASFSTNLTLEINPGPHTFIVEWEHDLFRMGDLSLKDIPRELQAAYLEAMLEPGLNRLEARTGKECTVRVLEQPQTTNQSFLSLQLVRCSDQRATHCRLTANEDDLLWFTELFGEPESREEDPDLLPLWGSIITGRINLSGDELRSLNTGDVLLVPLSENRVRVRFDSNLSFLGSLDQNNLTVEAIMSDQMIEQMEQTTFQLDTDALEIPLCFELGKTSISLGELKQLQPGMVLTLPVDSEKPVTITSGGQAIARGKQVSVGGRPGIRLMEVYDHARS